jgi:TolB protein
MMKRIVGTAATGCLALGVAALGATPAASPAPDLGLFEAQGDIGAVSAPGSVEYDPTSRSYLISGSGENMWSTQDALHYVWREVRGEVSLAADVEWVGTGGNPHRKAGVVIRQSLAPDAPYADVVVHGDGLTSLQYRETSGGPTQEIQANVKAPRRIRIERTGDTILMWLAAGEQPLAFSGAAIKLELHQPIFVGLGVCAHDNTRMEQARLSNVVMTLGTEPAGAPVLESTLETIAIDSRDRRVVYHTRDHIEAPNWSRDGQELIFNSDGRLSRIPTTGGQPTLIDTRFAVRCNNDHGLSPDGSQLAISDQTQGGSSRVYVVPTVGGTPRLVTPAAPSYWHGWSPDGQTLAYCAERGGNFDIYTIPVEGGGETRLTDAEGLDDGPDYSPDGQLIYFNSVRTGTMQIWRMKADGSEQTQITMDEHNNWFPHPSPDGKWIAFLSYESDVEGHPSNKDVMLRALSVETGEIEVLARLFGGQGTINVPSWSPDSTQLAFVSYRFVRP